MEREAATFQFLAILKWMAVADEHDSTSVMSYTSVVIYMFNRLIIDCCWYTSDWIKHLL